MGQTKAQGRPDPAEIIARLEEAREALVTALERCDANLFTKQSADGETIKRSLERTVDDLNFYYGSLAARALNLPQPPCLTRAEFASLREATMALQVAHRRFANLLHDLLPNDLEKTVADETHGTYTLRQILELAAAQYRLRTQQVEKIASKPAKRK